MKRHKILRGFAFLPRNECVPVVVLVLSLVLHFSAPARAVEVSASSTQQGFSPAGAVDDNPFDTEAGHVWKGSADAGSWWWQCRWDEPRDVGAILQVVGDDPVVLQNAPRKYVWQASLDGKTWNSLEGTAVDAERRMFRLHRLKVPRRLQYLRLQIDAVHGTFPALREADVFDDPHVKVEFPDWIAAVATIDRREWDEQKGEGRQFIPLACGCPGWQQLQAEYIWLDSFDDEFVSAEPRPLCGFLSGNFSDFCQKERYNYAAQFHIEMAGTNESSRPIVANFLQLAKEWGGYNPDAKPVAAPEPFATPR